MKIFYDHIIDIGGLIREVESLEITTEEKEELARIVDETVHHEVMTVILTHLPEQHHEEFLERFQARPHDPSLLEYLKAKVDGIEEKLAETGRGLRRKIKQLLK